MIPSIRALAAHLQMEPELPTTLRTVLRRGDGTIRLHPAAAPFSVLCQNMGLLPPLFYGGTDRAGAIWAVVNHIRAWSPDVVGLCEVFDDDERRAIRELLADVWPHYRGGPDEDDLEEDGGLVVMSKHPLLQVHAHIYRSATGTDALSNKGVIHVRVQPPGAPTPYDVFHTHMQDIDALFDGRDELYAQLSELADFVERHADPAAPTVVMGDLNVPAGDADAYRELDRRLRSPIDLWRRSGGSEADGSTVVADSNFDADPDDAPRADRRLDYVLLRAGTRHVPILDEMRVLRIRSEGRDISDHLGLLARFATSFVAESG